MARVLAPLAACVCVLVFIGYAFALYYQSNINFSYFVKTPFVAQRLPWTHKDPHAMFRSMFPAWYDVACQHWPRGEQDAPAVGFRPFNFRKLPAGTDLLAEYARWHAQSLQLGECCSKKVLIWRPSEGFGNRLFTGAGAVLMAMLTGRVFLVDWEPTSPTPWRLLFEEPPFAWDALEAAESRHVCPSRHSTTLDMDDRATKQRWVDSQDDPEACLKLFDAPTVILQGAWFSMPTFTEHRCFSALVDSFTSHSRAAAAAHTTERVSPHDALYSYILSGVFRPSLHVKAAMKDTLAQIKAQPTIGLQVRVGTASTSTFQWLDDGDEHKFFRCAQALGDSQLGSNWRVFIASDHSNVYQEAKKCFGERVIFPQEVDRVAHAQDSLDMPLVMQAMVDLLLLSECDVLIVTYSSSYGKSAAVYHNRPRHSISATSCAEPANFLQIRRGCATQGFCQTL